MAEPEDFSQLALPDLFAHKNWKARKAGYEGAAKEFTTAQPTDPIIREFTDGSLWKAAVSDSNVAAQQDALSAYNAFLEASGTDGARRTRGNTVTGVVEKGLTGRPAAKASATETLLLLIELDKADPIIEELLPFLAHKQPKIIAASLSALTTIVHAYGCKLVEPKAVVKTLPKIFGHADKNVRAEGQNLTVELYRWLREAMKPLFWGDLKDVQQKDLEKLFEPVKAEPLPKQERLLRSQQAAKEIADAAPAAEEEEVEEEAAEIDLEPEYMAVDVFAKVPKDFADRLASTKWKDRKEALDELFTAVNVPAIQEGPFDEIMRGLAKSMKDANIAVVAVAANCVECIAKGLRRSFTRYRSTILASMLERFKEKKVTVTDAIGAACDAVFAATSLGDIQADVLEALTSKNPQVKEQSAKFLARSLKATKDAPTPEQTKEIAEVSKKLLTESAVTLRDAGAEVIGVLWRIMGDRNMLSHLDGLDEIRKNKIKEFSDAAEVRAKWKPKAVAPPPPKAAPPAKKPGPGTKRPAGSAKKAPPARAARAASPPLDGPDLQPQPTSRPAPKPAAAGLKPPGIKAPSGLAKPGSGLKAPTSGTASPRRQGAVFDEQASAPPAKPGLTAPGRGLAGRPLGKPSTAPASPPRDERPDTGQSALSAIERQELSELRSSTELLQQQNSDLRNDKMKQQSQITELQNQNAQLIEDHTRDVLQIKAKETQLVRARSDAENAEERANSLSKEIDRLKREMSRLGRVRAGSNEPGEPNGGTSDFAYPAGIRPAYGSSRSYAAPTSRPAYTGLDSFGGAGQDGKENIPADLRDGKLSGASVPASTTHGYSRPMSNGSSGRATPASVSADGEGSVSNGTGSGLGRTASQSVQGGDGVESWRRAAEVTQNLKARIEMMKARQNIGRGQ
ncbi:hypothetical protein LTR09_011818 [Extremus antarcticus]|uniref:TOG domain-containing protein n=1 Tax=Extremus antarcticus TaxID=702011 RepID=A0AAJ0D5X3_9PEZI|nr:hypothetical protein LTR09_011818 [Extremus antarcticus]